jgi:hypothetical protein
MFAPTSRHRKRRVSARSQLDRTIALIVLGLGMPPREERDGQSPHVDASHRATGTDRRTRR